MSRSIIGSIAGHVAGLLGPAPRRSWRCSAPWAARRTSPRSTTSRPSRPTLEKHPNVKTVVPMGTNGAFITSGNTVDLTLARLRALYRKPAAERETPERARADRQPSRRTCASCLRLLEDRAAGPPHEDARGHGGARRAGGAGRARQLGGVLGRLRPGSVRLARVPGEPARAAGGRRRPALHPLRGHGPGHVPEELRPHADRRRARRCPRASAACCCPSSSTRSSSS